MSNVSNTLVWLHRYQAEGVERVVVHSHNAIADYRAIDARATVSVLDVAAAIPALAAADRALRAFKALGTAQGVADNHACRIECERAMKWLDESMTAVRGAA